MILCAAYYHATIIIVVDVFFMHFPSMIDFHS